MIPVFYIPGRPVPTDASLQAIGLWFGAGYAHAELLGGGPDARDGGAGRGCLVYWLPPTQPLGLNLNQHAQWSWTRAKPDPQRNLPGGRYWIGQTPGVPILPEALARRQQYPSVAVRLDDDQLWQIPIARSLPHEFGFDDYGNQVRRVKPPFAAYHDLAMEFLAALIEAGSPIRKELHVSDAWRLAELGLSLNYRVNRDVIDWLRIATDEESLYRIACASIELGLWVAIDEQKKTAGCTPAI